MDEKTSSKEQPEVSASSDKQVWVKPQITLVPPKLTKHGGLTRITGQSFFGAFSPGADD